MFVGAFALLFCPLLFSNSQVNMPVLDTINQVNDIGHKYGHWVIYGHMKKDKAYASEAKVEEGKYEENKRTGLWKKYFPNGKVKSKINYKRNIPNGPYALFFENGVTEEEGNWKNNRNTNDFKRYHKNGKLAQEFQFSTTGKRNGKQKYFHENGQMELLVSIVDGKENGEMKRWFPNGDLKESRVYNNGIVDEASIEVFQPKKAPVVVKEISDVLVKVSVAPAKTEKTNISVFKANGRNILYNKNMQISQSGIFKNGKLKDGKWYRYTKDGILEKIEMYKNGKYIGDALMEEN